MKSRVRRLVAGLLALLALPAASGSTAAADVNTFTFPGTAVGAAEIHPFQVNSPSTITINLDWNDPAVKLTVLLKTPAGVTVASNTSNARPKKLTYQAVATGKWKINVKAVTGSANYTATVALSDPAPTPTAPAYVRTIGGPGHAGMYPSGLDVDPSGIVYIADTGNDQVAAYGPAGNQLWRVGIRGPRADGSFSNPRDLAYLNGKLYVADTEYNRVQVLNASDGSFVTKWGYRFGSLIGISAGVDAAGNAVILTCEDDRNAVSKFTPAGALITPQLVAPKGKALGQLNGPRDAATDSAGRVYVADYANDRMVRFAANFTAPFAWGVKGTGPGQFGRPYGVAIDAANQVYVADSNNQRIQVFTMTGGFVRQMGSEGVLNGQFTQHRRVAVGTGVTPDVYGADLWGNHVTRFSNGGSFEQKYGGSGPSDNGFNEPTGLALFGSDVFVADSVNQRIQQFTTSDVHVKFIGHRGWESTVLDGFNWPRDLGFTGSTFWVADTKNNRLTEFNPTSGAPTGRKMGAVGTGANQLHWPFGIAGTGADLVVADTFNNRIQRWNTATGLTSWTYTAVTGPKDVAVAAGFVFVADTNANRVLKLNAGNGQLVDMFGSLHNPQGIAVDGSGNIWVADTNWNRLVQYSPAGVFLQSFGGQAAGSGNDQFRLPTKIEIVGNTMYVADTFNDRIQVYTIG
ncbi:MAG: tripartite motif-containing protein 71 [Gaiellales bacterium]|nr:tripartite motif-containing protein 71 [Gaiellales bacterium]